MADNQNNKVQTIFSTVLDAINGSKHKAPLTVPGSASQFTPDMNRVGTGLKKPANPTEEIQQQYMDWQSTKIAHNLYQRTIYFDTDRIGAYQDFRAMDMSPEISAALDIITDETMTRAQNGKIIQIYSENERIKAVLEDLFTTRLNAEFNMKLWIRDLIKMGDYFIKLDIHKDDGIYNVTSLPVEEIHKEIGFDGNPESVRYRMETTNDYFEDWQIAHFCMLSDTKRIPYGRSILDSARKLWKQLQLAEDAMLVYRLCLHGDTRIKTDNGYKYIKDIKIGDRVLSYDTNEQCKYSTVTDHVNNGIKNLYKIKSVHNEIICTETHPILVNEGGIIKYVDANQLVPKKHKLINTNTNNLIEIPKKIERIYFDQTQEHKLLLVKKESCKKHIGNKTKQKYSSAKIVPYGNDDIIINEKNDINNVNTEKIYLPEYVDVEFSRLLGFLIGNECSKDNEISFYAGGNKYKNKHYENILKHYFGAIEYKKEGKHIKCLVKNIFAEKVFANLDYIIDGSHNKRIPGWVFNQSIEVKKALIYGISDAKMCKKYYKGNTFHCSIKMYNKELVEDIKELWSSIGLQSGLIKVKQEKNKQTTYTLDLSDLKLDKYENVISVTPCGEDEVYDITVDNVLHNFIANNIPVHNTRAPDRRIFYVDVGTIEPGDIAQYIKKMQSQVIRGNIVDPRSGNVDIKYNPLNVTEDFWIPIRGEKNNSRIDTLPGACLSLNTKIELLDGRSLELNEIIKEYENEKQLWGYSIDPINGKIVPGKITWAGKTRLNTQVVKITLDNGESVVVTPDHKFPTRLGTKKEAKDLITGESLWSFNKQFKSIFHNTNKEKSSYEMVYDHSLNQWVFTRTLFENYIREKDKQNETYKQEYNLNNWVMGFVDFEEKAKLYNHKIVSIEWLEEKQDTGTITIDGEEEYHNFHNFALSCGVFTNNSNTDQIEDIIYLEKKLFASLKVPKAYLNYSEGLQGGSLLSQSDIRFARTINNIQTMVLLELRRIAKIHLYFSGFKDDIENFTLALTNPSTQQELLKLETMKARNEVASGLYSPESTSFYSWTKVMEDIHGCSHAEIKLILKQKKIEKKLFAEIDSAVETYNKIGLFKEIDAKYELPAGMQAQLPGGEEDKGVEHGPGGGGGGGSFDFGTGIGGTGEGGAEGTEGGGEPGGTPGGEGATGNAVGGGVPGSPSGGAPSGGAPAGGGGPSGISESIKNKTALLKRVLTESSNRIDELINDLLPEEPVEVMKESELTKKSTKVNHVTKKLLESMETVFNNAKPGQKLGSSSAVREYKMKNSLVESSNEMLDKTSETLSKIDIILNGMKTTNEATAIIDEPEILSENNSNEIEDVDIKPTDNNDDDIEPVEQPTI